MVWSVEISSGRRHLSKDVRAGYMISGEDYSGRSDSQCKGLESGAARRPESLSVVRGRRIDEVGAVWATVEGPHSQRHGSHWRVLSRGMTGSDLRLRETALAAQ